MQCNTTTWRYPTLTQYYLGSLEYVHFGVKGCEIVNSYYIDGDQYESLSVGLDDSNII